MKNFRITDLKNPKSSLLWVACVASIIFSMIFLRSLTTSFESDPDRFYHFALSREMLAKGYWYLVELPQVEGLGWDKYFVEKEFLYHQLTSVAYYFKQESGVIFLTFGLSIISALAFFQFTLFSLPPLIATTLTIFLFSLPQFFFRLNLVRPHCLSILLFFVFQIGLLRRKPLLAFISSLLFTLSYHAFYMVGICCLLSIAAKWIEERKGDSPLGVELKPELLGLLGIFAGVLVNPYFPSNVQSSIQIAMIPKLMQGELSRISFGMELYSPQASEFLRLFYVPMICMTALLCLMGYELRKVGSLKLISSKLSYLTVTSGFLLILAFQSPRMIEYLVPITGFALVLLLERISAWNFRRTLFFFAPMLVIFVHGLSVIVGEGRKSENPWVVNSKDILTAIPLEGEKKKVFNCEWEISPSIYYHRPDLQFIDILDPSLLYFANRGAFQSREALRNGLVADVYGLIKNGFKADYALCSDPGIVQQLDQDPGFRRLSPSKAWAKQKGYVSPVLFELSPSSAPQFIQSFQVTKINDFKAAEIFQYSLQSLENRKGTTKEHLAESSYMNLFSVFSSERILKEDEAHCALVGLPKEEISRIQGAEYLVLGGGRGFQFWLNGKPVFSTQEAFLRSQATQIVVPLERKLALQDRIEVMVCSAKASQHWGLSLSAWTKRELENHCSQKNALEPKEIQWPLTGSKAMTCLGPMASPNALSR